MIQVAGDAEKFTLLNLTSEAVGFTLWVAIIAVPFQNLSAFGVDQLNAQRMFCCRDALDARKAMITSSGALLLTLLMLFVGAALFAYYEPMRTAGTEPSIFTEDTNSVFPVWIVTELSVGLRGLILARYLQPLFQALILYWQHFLKRPSGYSSQGRKDAEKETVSRVLVLIWEYYWLTINWTPSEERQMWSFLPLA